MIENNIGYKWHPIEDYSPDKDGYHDSGLTALAKVWQEQKNELNAKGLVDRFSQQLQRQWAIETGVLERLYTLDRGVTQILIEKGIEANYISHESTNKDPVLVAQIIKDQYDIVDSIFDFVKEVRPLSTSYIKELHAALCRNQETTQGVDQFGQVHDVPLLRGCYKERPNSPKQVDGLIHEYCPPIHVESEMDRLIKLYHKHESSSQPLAPEIEAAWLHHRFTQIHPFQDGNGRIARALASLIFIKAGWFPLTVTRDDRVEYINALEQADQGNLASLIEFFAKIQRRTFTSALGLVGQLQNTSHISSIITDIREKLESKRHQLHKEREKAKNMATMLIDMTQKEMESTAQDLKRQLKKFFSNSEIYVKHAANEDSHSHYYRNQIIAMAKGNGYFANPAEYRAWCCLVLPGKNPSEILVSAHAIGSEYRGVIAISACFFSRNESGDQHKEIGDFSSLGKEYFQLNYADEEKSVRNRFSSWLNSVLISGLAIWNANLEI